MEAKGRRLSTECALCLLLCWATLAVSQHVPCSEEAKYLVSVECNWTDTTHPIDYPTVFPHFSPMCGTVHNEHYRMWNIGGISTTGIKDIAETGSCTAFQQEVDACKAAQNCKGETFSWLCYAKDEVATVCTFSGSISVSEQHSSVSLLTMLAPSPDWIVGIDSIDLCGKDEEGHETFWKTQWPQQDSFALYPIDAGTDGGDSYQSADEALENFEPIAFFYAMNNTNIFYNPKEETMMPICQLKITLEN